MFHIKCASKRIAESSPRRSFSLVELLIVIAIIGLLAGLLFTAFHKVRESAKKTETLAIMQAFLNACQAFSVEHGYSPGLIPESVLAYHNHAISHGQPGFAIGSTENAILHLMGGYVVKGTVPDQAYNAASGKEYTVMSPNGPDIKFKFDIGRLGEGPVIDGKSYPCYFHPSANEVRVLDDGSPNAFQQWPWNSGLKGDVPPPLPDLADAWGNPIIYLRESREFGQMVSDAHNIGIKPQFYIDTIWPYTLGKSQVWIDPCSGGDGHGSILYGSELVAGEASWDVDKALAMIVRHPSTKPADPLDATAAGKPLGSIVLISAGPDGLYYGADDGPGSPKKPIGCAGCGNFTSFSYDEFLKMDPKAIDSFDDIRVWGSGGQ